MTFLTSIHGDGCEVDMAKAPTTSSNKNCLDSIGQEINSNLSIDHDVLMIWIVHGFTDGNNRWQQLMSDSYFAGWLKYNVI